MAFLLPLLLHTELINSTVSIRSDSRSGRHFRVKLFLLQMKAASFLQFKLPSQASVSLMTLAFQASGPVPTRPRLSLSPSRIQVRTPTGEPTSTVLPCPTQRPGPVRCNWQAGPSEAWHDDGLTRAWSQSWARRRASSGHVSWYYPSHFQFKRGSESESSRD